MKSVLAVSLLIACAATAAPLEIDRAVTAVSGTEARFVHRFTPKGFQKSQTESGSVVFGKLPMMRWSYQKPEAKIFVFDGNRSWLYVPSDRQVTVANLDERGRAELPFLLLGDPAVRDQHFAVREQRRGNRITTTLTSRAANALVRTVTVVSNGQTHLIDSIDYADRDGNRTAFTFSGYRPTRTTAETFRFTPPSGVQVVWAN